MSKQWRSERLETISDFVITIAATIAAVVAIFGTIFAIYKWYLKQEKQDKDIKKKSIH